MKRKFLVLLAALMLFSYALNAQVKPGDIIGFWFTANKDAKIEIYKASEKFYGKIVWLKTPTNENGKPKVDKHNPDETKRSNPIVGLVLLNGFVFKGDEWKGTIYDPESGKTYSSYLSLKDNNTLKVRGYIGISLLGRTEVWTRGN